MGERPSIREVQDAALEALLSLPSTEYRVLVAPFDLLSVWAGRSTLHGRQVTVLTAHEQIGNNSFREDSIDANNHGFYVVDSARSQDPYGLVQHAKRWFWAGQHLSGDAFLAFDYDHYEDPRSSFSEELKMLGMRVDFNNPGYLLRLVQHFRQV